MVTRVYGPNLVLDPGVNCPDMWIDHSNINMDNGWIEIGSYDMGGRTFASSYHVQADTGAVFEWQFDITSYVSGEVEHFGQIMMSPSAVTSINADGTYVGSATSTGPRNLFVRVSSGAQFNVDNIFIRTFTDVSLDSQLQTFSPTLNRKFVLGIDSSQPEPSGLNVWEEKLSVPSSLANFYALVSVESWGRVFALADVTSRLQMAMYVSSDGGEVWSGSIISATSGFGGLGVGAAAYADHLDLLCVGGGGNLARIFTTSDGENYVEQTVAVTTPAIGAIRGMTYANSQQMLYAITHRVSSCSYLLTSSDAVNWTRVASFDGGPEGRTVKWVPELGRVFIGLRTGSRVSILSTTSGGDIFQTNVYSDLLTTAADEVRFAYAPDRNELYAAGTLFPTNTLLVTNNGSGWAARVTSMSVGSYSNVGAIAYTDRGVLYMAAYAINAASSFIIKSSDGGVTGVLDGISVGTDFRPTDMVTLPTDSKILMASRSLFGATEVGVHGYIEGFSVPVNDISTRVLKWPKIKHSWDNLKPLAVTVPVANHDGALNYLIADERQSIGGKATIYLDATYANTPLNDGYILHRGVVTGLAADGGVIDITVTDKVRDLANRVIGTSDDPVAYTGSNYLPSDVAWWLCTSHGGMSAAQNSSNPDIDYEKFSSWAESFSSSNIFVNAEFRGTNVLTTLRKMARMTHSAIYLDRDKIRFSRFGDLGSNTLVISNGYILDYSIDIDEDQIVNRQYVFADYDVTSKYFKVAVTDQDSHSQQSYGLKEQVEKDESIWYVDSATALNLAQRNIAVKKYPFKIGRIKTGMNAVRKSIGEIVQISDVVLGDAPTYRVMQREVDLDRGLVTLNGEQGQIINIFILDISTLDGTDVLG